MDLTLALTRTLMAANSNSDRGHDRKPTDPPIPTPFTALTLAYTE